jgi:hypothetical protein
MSQRGGAMPQERLDRAAHRLSNQPVGYAEVRTADGMRFDLNQRRAPPAVAFRGALQVANWFYLAFIVPVAVLHVTNNAAIPISIFSSKSYIVWSGVQDAMVEWWYGHNAVCFFLTAGFFGLTMSRARNKARRRLRRSDKRPAEPSQRPSSVGLARRVAAALQTFPSFTSTNIAPKTGTVGRGNAAMVSEGRLLWLTPLEWSLLLVSAALCGCLSLVGA